MTSRARTMTLAFATGIKSGRLSALEGVVVRLVRRTIVPSASLSHRIDGLDELRGIATLWVMVCHGTGLTKNIPQVASGLGFHGVVLFFIVSGFLITKILLKADERQEPLRNFYIRRWLRIWPLMIMALVVSFTWRWSDAANGVFNFLLVNNYAMAVGLEPPFRTDIMWSLAIEEQFYLLWPLVLFALPSRWLPVVLGAIIFLGFSFDGGLVDGGHFIIPKTTHGCMQYIAMGAAIAFGRAGLRATLAACALFLAMFVVAHPPGWQRTLPWYLWYGMSFALFGLAYYTCHVAPLIKSMFLMHIGRLCYGMYIIHFFVSALVLEHLGRTTFIGFLLFALLSYGLALASFYAIERPALAWRGPIEAQPRLQATLLAGVAFAALASLVIVVSRLAVPA